MYRVCVASSSKLHKAASPIPKKQYLIQLPTFLKALEKVLELCSYLNDSKTISSEEVTQWDVI